jgi:hypothetical protein
MRGVLLLALLTFADGPARLDDRLPYRTDTANEQLPGYRLKPGEFPPLGSEHRVSGELLEADFIHRSGQFRSAETGELAEFSLLPFATVMACHAEGDLRDIPLGTLCQFALYQDDRGAFTKVAAIHDESSRLANQGLIYRLDKANVEAGKLDVTLRRLNQGQEDLGHSQLSVSEETRVWKSGGKAKLGDLAVGDELLVNVSGNTPQGPGRCLDIWAGAEAQKLATEQQHKRHESFLKERGLACWIDRVDGKKLTVTLFGDPPSLQALCKREGIVPSQWATEHRGVDSVVANEELRTYNPPVDRKRARVLEFQPIATDAHGCSGIRWVIEPDLLLEGFRKGRIIRLFAHPSWPVNDMPFGEGLYSEAPNVKPATLEPLHYPYRTDFANEDLPWYRLRPGEFPPFESHHLVCGELVKVDVAHRSGQFRTDRTGELVDFTMPPFGTVLSLNAEADLRDLTIGTRCLFFLHQEDRGAFTKATVIMDHYTRFARDDLSYRIDALELAKGRILLSWRHAPVRDEKEALIQPPDLGRGEFAVDDKTRVWKGDRQIALSKLAVGDELLLNLSGQTASSRGICTDIWVGRETHKLVTEKQRVRHDAFLKETGLPAWVESVEGKTLTIHFFSGNPNHFRTLLNSDVKGDGILLTPVDEELGSTGPTSTKWRLKEQMTDGSTVGTYGSSGMRWRIEAEKLDEPIRAGQILRVFREGWPIRSDTGR